MTNNQQTGKLTPLRTLRAAALAASLGLAAGSPAHAGEMPAILTDAATQAEHYLPDFSYAGYGYGLKDIPHVEGKVIDVTDHGARANDARDDSQAVLKALEAAHKVRGPVVLRFPAGVFILSEILFLERNDIVLRGAGRGVGGTQLHFPRPLNMVDKTDHLNELREYLVENNKRQREKNRNLDVLFSEYSWSGGFIWVRRPEGRASAYLERYDTPGTKLSDLDQGTRGGLTLTAATPGALEAGDVIQIQWFNRDGKDGPLIDAIYGGSGVEVGSRHWETPDRALVRQTTTVTAVEGNRITIANPLLHDVSARLPAQATAIDPLRQVGIEDLHITFPASPDFGHHVEQGYNGIYFTGVFDGWIRNVRITNADSGILTYDSANVTIRDVETDGGHTAHYSVHIGNVHNVLVDGLTVFNPVRHSLSFNTRATRSVYTNARVFQSPVLDQHAGSNHQNLFDNIKLRLTARRRDGTASYPVFDGSGAKYWQPGHGAFNTTWNLAITVEGGAEPGETLTVLGADEGPMARIVGVHANRPLTLDYRPSPYVEMIGQEPTAVPSLYHYQLNKRRAALNARD